MVESYVGVSIIWFIFEVLEYHLMTLVCNGLILKLVKCLGLYQHISTKIPKVLIPQKPVLEIVSSLRIELNKGFAAIIDIGSGKHLKKFLSRRGMTRSVNCISSMEKGNINDTNYRRIGNLTGSGRREAGM
ncbi:unnamed protein product [Lactuca saligna]|uniref:Reticulon domain-containing protein n=1 Tax=Lactuca saligna TaxID=75948 RepID=A0AA35YZR2_LACSI|nr:unnamed protein product [Lactuca saligna]